MDRDTPNLSMIPLGLIDVPQEQRLRVSDDDSEVDALAATIREHGLIHPVTVREVDERFRLIAGWRRLCAFKLLGRAAIPAMVVDGEPGSDLAVTVIENLQRSNLSAMEESSACAVLLQTTQLDVDGVAATLGRSRGWVDSRLELLTWPAELQEAVHLGQISVAVGRVLAKVPDDVERRNLTEHAVLHGITAKQANLWLQQALSTPIGGLVQEAEADGGAPIQPVYVTTCGCFSCGDQIELSEIRQLRFCPKCVEAVASALSRAG